MVFCKSVYLPKLQSPHLQIDYIRVVKKKSLVILTRIYVIKELVMCKNFQCVSFGNAAPMNRTLADREKEGWERRFAFGHYRKEKCPNTRCAETFPLVIQWSSGSLGQTERDWGLELELTHRNCLSSLRRQLWQARVSEVPGSLGQCLPIAAAKTE